MTDRAATTKAVEQALLNYQLSNMVYDEHPDEPYRLVDLLTPSGEKNIASGEEEIGRLADFVANSLPALTAPRSSPRLWAWLGNIVMLVKGRRGRGRCGSHRHLTKNFNQNSTSFILWFVPLPSPPSRERFRGGTPKDGYWSDDDAARDYGKMMKPPADATHCGGYPVGPAAREEAEALVAWLRKAFDFDDTPTKNLALAKAARFIAREILGER